MGFPGSSVLERKKGKVCMRDCVAGPGTTACAGRETSTELQDFSSCGLCSCSGLAWATPLFHVASRFPDDHSWSMFQDPHGS